MLLTTVELHNPGLIQLFWHLNCMLNNLHNNKYIELLAEKRQMLLKICSHFNT